jgi:hypothetical protein
MLVSQAKILLNGLVMKTALYTVLEVDKNFHYPKVDKYYSQISCPLCPVLHSLSVLALSFPFFAVKIYAYAHRKMWLKYPESRE